MASTVSLAKSNNCSLIRADSGKVTIRIGTLGTEFSVSKVVMCQHSRHLQNAFQGPFKEATSGHISFPDVSEETFKLFLRWASLQNSDAEASDDCYGINRTEGAQKIYTSDSDRIFSCKDPEGAGLSEGKEKINSDADPDLAYFVELDEWDRLDKEYWTNEAWLEEFYDRVRGLFTLFVFADAYDVPQLRDDILSALVGYCINFWFWPDPQVDLFIAIYDLLPPRSQFCRFLVNSIACYWVATNETPKSLDSMRELPYEFVFDLMVKESSFKGENYSDNNLMDSDVLRREKAMLLDPCNYHDHDILDQEQCRDRRKKKNYIFTTLARACRELTQAGKPESDQKQTLTFG